MITYADIINRQLWVCNFLSNVDSGYPRMKMKFRVYGITHAFIFPRNLSLMKVYCIIWRAEPMERRAT